MSVDAIPVLPPCGDRLKRGAAGPGNEDRETLRGHCLIGANSTSPNAAKRKPTRVLSRCPGAINIGICRTALRFPDLARLPEAVSEACYFSMLFPPRSSTSRDYLCLSSCTLACGSVQCGSANFGSARLSLSSALAHCCPSKNLGGGARGVGEVDSFQLESQGSHHAGEPCPSSVPFSTWTIPPVTGGPPTIFFVGLSWCL